MGNSILQLSLAAVNDAAFLLCGAFLVYVVLIVVPFLRHRPSALGDASAFEWHFLVPCRDEERVVEATVRRMLGQFPTAHIWCIDDASMDGTPRVLSWLASAESRVHLIRRELPIARQGKGPALNAGWTALVQSLGPVDAERVVVGVVDADGHLDHHCLNTITGPTYFLDPTVGSVQIKVRVETEDKGAERSSTSCGPVGRLLVRLQDLEFSSIIAAMQMLRRHVGSVGMGGNGQFTRLSVLNKIAVEHGSPWHGALLEDFELGLHVLMSGSRTEYCHDTWVSQEGLPTLKGLVRQRSRWAQGSMQCMRYLIPVLRSRVIPTAGALEIAYFLFLPWVQLFGGVLYLACLGVMLQVVFTTGASQWLSSGAWGVFPLFLIFGVVPLVVWGPVYRRKEDSSVSAAKALMLGVANWPYIYFHQVAIWWAFIRILRSRHDWKKTERFERQPTVVPATMWLPSISPVTVRGTFVPRRQDCNDAPSSPIVTVRFRSASAVGVTSASADDANAAA
ncbi:MAG: hypothetical protein DLM54_03985 [Acidimicrobiales bacterium]|nr:MAG: hypothetical protein DLM54_03985 [Acidimicrobiales bacterium]